MSRPHDEGKVERQVPVRRVKHVLYTHQLESWTFRPPLRSTRCVQQDTPSLVLDTMPETVTMQPYSPQQSVETDTHSHRGPLSRTWPQLFKKRRRYSPVRESAQQAQPVPQQQPPRNPGHHQHPPLYAQVPPQAQSQPQFQASVPLRPVKHPGISTASIRSPSITADTASTISTISKVSSLPASTTKRVPIARRTSSIGTSDSNGTSPPLLP